MFEKNHTAIKTLQGMKVIVGRRNGGWNRVVGVGMERCVQILRAGGSVD